MKVLSVDGLSKLISLMKEDFVESSSLSTVATSGSYNDLTNKPVEIPSQSGNSGKFLTTDGSVVSWATVSSGFSYTAGTGIDITNGVISTDDNVLINVIDKNNDGIRPVVIDGNVYDSAAYYGVCIGKGSTIEAGGVAIGGTWGNNNYGARASTSSVAIGYLSQAGTLGSANNGCISIGSYSVAQASGFPIAIGHYAEATGNHSIVIGSYTGGAGRPQATATCAIQIGCGTVAGTNYTNSDANTLKIGNQNGNFELMSSDGTIPNARLNIMTGADGTNAGTKGAVPAPAATDNTKFLRGDGTWATVSGGGSSLPDQTGQSGKYLTTNGTTASWGTITIPTVDQTYDGTSSNAQSGVAIAGAGFIKNNTTSPYSWVISNTASNQDGLTILGKDSSSTKARSTVLGRSAQSTGKTGIVIGYAAYVSADHAIQIGTGTNSAADTLNIGFDNDTTANRKNWCLLDGTTGLIPDARISTNIARTTDIPSTTNMQTTTNLVTSLSSSSTDTQYPSAKCVYDLIGNLESILNNINNGNIS